MKGYSASIPSSYTSPVPGKGYSAPTPKGVGSPKAGVGNGVSRTAYMRGTRKLGRGR